VHPGTARSEEGEDKFNLERADKAMPWIEEEFERFLKELPGDKKCWRPALADQKKHSTNLDNTVPTACTHPLITSNLSQLTHTSHIECFVWKFPPVDK
jgi:hypothetical protein